MPSLALCMIVRDEEALLPGCLESARDVVDEMVVLDTGSHDRTVELAQAAGARVHAFAWCDDFAAARNAALSHVRSDWILVLDADERLGPGAGAVLRAAVARGGFACGLLPVHHAAAPEASLDEVLEGRGRDGEPVLLPRLLRVAPGLRWTGIVRETPEGVDGSRAALVSAPVVHYGYTRSRRAARQASARDLRLLRRRCASEPANPWMWAALASELADRGTRGAALRAADTAWQCVRAAWSRGESPRAVAVARVRADLLGRVGRDAEALAMFDAIAARPEGGDHPDVPYRRARLLADADPRAALAQYRAALALRGRLYDEPVTQGATSHASLLGLARIALRLGHSAMAREFASGAVASPGAPVAAQVTRAECDIAVSPGTADTLLARLPEGEGGDVALLRAACAEARGDEDGLRRHLAAFEATGSLEDPYRQPRAIFLRVAARVGTRLHVPATTVDADCAAATDALAEGRVDEAAAHACAALRADPGCGRAWMSLVLALRLAGRPGFALLAARGAVHAAPADTDVLVASALAHESAGDAAHAVEAARAVLQRDGRHREARGVVARAGVHAASAVGDSPAVTVVVRVGEEPEDVVRLLDRLALQEPGGPAFDVVLCGVEGVSVLVLPGPRPYPLRHVHARSEADAWNAGWRAATAPIVLFLEPDAVPGPEILAGCVRDHARPVALVRAGARLQPHRSDTSCASLLFARRQAAAPVAMHGLSIGRRVLEALGGFARDLRHADALATELWVRALSRGEVVRDASEGAVSRRSPVDAGSVLAAEEVLGADAVRWFRRVGTAAPWDESLDGSALASARERLESMAADAEDWAFVVAQAGHLGVSAEPDGRETLDTCIERLAGWRRLRGAWVEHAMTPGEG